ncbi:MAG: hypothetical protein WBD02_02830, partial [Acidimicrobiia bacterium]
FTASGDLDRRSQVVEDVDGSRAAFRAVLNTIPAQTDWQAPKVDITEERGDAALVNVQLRAVPIDLSSSSSSSIVPPDLVSIAANLRSLDLADLVFTRHGDAWQLSAYSACFIRSQSLAAAVVTGSECTATPLPPSIVSSQTPTESGQLSDPLSLTYANAGGVTWAMRCEGCADVQVDPQRAQTSISLRDRQGNEQSVATVNGSVSIIEDVQHEATAIASSGNGYSSPTEAEVLYLDSGTAKVTSRERIAQVENDLGTVSIDREKHTVYRIESRPETLKEDLGRADLGSLATSIENDLVERKVSDGSEVRRWTLGVDTNTNQRGDYDQFEVHIVGTHAVATYKQDTWTIDLGDAHVRGAGEPRISDPNTQFVRRACADADGYIRLVVNNGGSDSWIGRIEKYDTATLTLQDSVDVSATELACGLHSIWTHEAAVNGLANGSNDPITLVGRAPVLTLEGYSPSDLELRATINSVSTENIRSGWLVVVGDEPSFTRAGVLTQFSGERDFSPAK